jgi:hypothetical protein
MSDLFGATFNDALAMEVFSFRAKPVGFLSLGNSSIKEATMIPTYGNVRTMFNKACEACPGLIKTDEGRRVQNILEAAQHEGSLDDSISADAKDALDALAGFVLCALVNGLPHPIGCFL